MATITVGDSGKVLTLSTRERLHWFVGRAAGCELHLDDPGISRYHATIFQAAGAFYLLDHSFNGTYLCRGDEPAGADTRVPTLPRSFLGAEEAGARHAQGGADTAELAAVRDPAEPGRPEAESHPSLHKSHVLMKLEERSGRLPRMLGYEAHSLNAPAKMQPMLKAIYSAEEAANLASLARRLTRGARIVFIGSEKHELRFEE